MSIKNKSNTILFKTRIVTACQDHQAEESAVKCHFQVFSRMARVGFKPRPCRLQLWRSNHSTTLPTLEIESKGLATHAKLVIQILLFQKV